MEGLFTLPYFNQLYEVMVFLNENDICTLFQLDRKTYEFCRSNRLVQDLLMNKVINRYIRKDMFQREDLFYILITAVREGNPRVVDELIRRGCDPSQDDNSVILCACVSRNVEVMNRLLQDPRIQLSTQENRAIEFAADCGHVDIVKRLLQSQTIDPSEALESACRQGHYELFDLLMKDPRTDPTVTNNAAIVSASYNGHIKMVKRLLENPRVDPSVKNNRAVRWSSHRGHFKVVKRLLKDPRVDPNARNNQALRWARLGMFTDIVSLLEKYA